MMIGTDHKNERIINAVINYNNIFLCDWQKKKKTVVNNEREKWNRMERNIEKDEKLKMKRKISEKNEKLKKGKKKQRKMRH